MTLLSSLIAPARHCHTGRALSSRQRQTSWWLSCSRRWFCVHREHRLFFGSGEDPKKALTARGRKLVWIAARPSVCRQGCDLAAQRLRHHCIKLFEQEKWSDV